MRRELELRRRLETLRTLGEAIGAMKSLAAHHFRETRAQLEATREYRQNIDRIVAMTGASLPAGDGQAGLLILGAEFGLCGGYSARLLGVAHEHRTKLGPGPTWCLGRRTALLSRRHGVSIDRTYAAPASGRALIGTLLDVASDLLTDYLGRRLSALDVLSHRFEGVGTYRPTITRLLPVDAPKRTSNVSTRYVAEETLSRVAARELLYATLHGLLLDAMAAEHGARLVATQSAESWLDEHSRRLRSRLTSARREASTQEVIEIASGAASARRRRA